MVMKPNVINVKHDELKIFKALKKGLSKNFRDNIKNIRIYGNGNSSENLEILKRIDFLKFDTQKSILN